MNAYSLKIKFQQDFGFDYNDMFLPNFIDKLREKNNYLNIIKKYGTSELSYFGVFLGDKLTIEEKRVIFEKLDYQFKIKFNL